jgi:hypothetical protein
MKTPRRGFLKGLAVVPLAPAAIGPQATPVPAPAPPPAAPPPPRIGYEAVADALTEAVKREFGAHLDATELEAVGKELQRGLERAVRLHRAARLSNADGPVNRFEARPPQAAGGGQRR